MDQAVQFVHGHPYLVSVAGTWIFNNIITVMISSLAAPTKESSASYVYWFKVLNSITGNLKRAQSTALENSPNWQDAVNAHLQKLSDNGTLLVKPTTAP